MSTDSRRSGRRWLATALVMLSGSIIFPVVFGIVVYGGCDPCGGGIFLVVSYLYAIGSSVLLLAFSAATIHRRTGHAAGVPLAGAWLVLGLPILTIGSMGVAWGIHTGEHDLAFFYMVVMVVPALSGVLTLVGLWRTRARRTSADQGGEELAD